MIDYTPDFWFLEKDSPPDRETPSTITTYLSKPLYRTTREALITTTILIVMCSKILSCICYFTSPTLREHRKRITFFFATSALCISLNPTWAATCPAVMNITTCPYFQMADFFANYLMAVLGILLVYRLALSCHVLASALGEGYKEFFRPRTWRQGHGWEVIPQDVDQNEPRVVR